MVMCQCRFDPGKKCTTLVENVDNEGGSGSMWELSAPPSQFCWEPRTALKKIKSLFSLFFSFLFNWSIVDLQCCISFRCTAK